MPFLNKEQINEIAQELDSGFRCFWNRNNNELIFIPDELRHADIQWEAWKEDKKKLKKNAKDYIEIEGLSSHDSFKIMESFAASIEDNDMLKQQLLNSLSYSKPFSHFKFLVDNSDDYRDKWFDFKNQKLQDWVIRKLEIVKGL